jgi:hypothetical protein
MLSIEIRKNMKPVAATINALIQGFAFVGTFQFNIVWAIYPLIMLTVLIILAQTITSAFAIANLENAIKTPPTDIHVGLNVLVGFMYAASTYLLFSLGYVFFAGVLSTHVAIYLLTILFKKETK